MRAAEAGRSFGVLAPPGSRRRLSTTLSRSIDGATRRAARTSSRRSTGNVKNARTGSYGRAAGVMGERARITSGREHSECRDDPRRVTVTNVWMRGASRGGPWSGEFGRRRGLVPSLAPNAEAAAGPPRGERNSRGVMGVAFGPGGEVARAARCATGVAGAALRSEGAEGCIADATGVASVNQVKRSRGTFGGGIGRGRNGGGDARRGCARVAGAGDQRGGRGRRSQVTLA